MKICIVATNGRSLTDFRGKFIKKLVELGHKVICISIEPEDEMAEKIATLGASYVQVAGDRISTGLFSGFQMIKGYQKCFEKHQPDLCFLYMSKPIAFGGYAAVRAEIKHIYVLVNGLENAYYRTGLKDFIVRRVMSSFYRFISKKADCVFMQNRDDRQYFIDHGIANENKLTIVNGSGVDMQYYTKQTLPEEPVFLMVARLLWSKGIREYLSAIPVVKNACPEARFMLVGGLDQNDEALSGEELNRWIADYEIDYCGFTDDVRPYLAKASVFVLPSYHEGTPRSVLEAMASGRAIITSDAPGCRETVINGENGFLVPVQDSEKLAEAMIKLANNQQMREMMGEKSYQFCLEKYEVNQVNQFMIEKMTV